MKLPKSVQEIADVIGSERALFLISKLPRCYSGSENKKTEKVILYVPTMARLKVTHRLVSILGLNDAVKLSRTFGGEILCPGNCNLLYKDFRDMHIVRLVREGLPLLMVAQWFDMSERHVRNIVKENPSEEVQAANDNNPRIRKSRVNSRSEIIGPC